MCISACRFACFFCLHIFLSGIPAGAQIKEQEPAIRIGVDVVRIPAHVMDSEGRPIPNLKISDFRIIEDGIEQKAALFEEGTEPVHISLVVDTSLSTGKHLGKLVEAARQFAMKFGLADKFAVYEAGPQVLRLLGFTSERNLLLDALRGLRTAEATKSRSSRKGHSTILKQNTGRGGTLLYDALTLVKQDFPAQAGRRVIIVFTDGWDSGSDADFRGVQNAILWGNEQVFAVLVDPEVPLPAPAPEVVMSVARPARGPERWALIFDTLTRTKETLDAYERLALVLLEKLLPDDRIWLFSFEHGLAPVFRPPARLSPDGSLMPMDPQESRRTLELFRVPPSERALSNASRTLVLPDRVVFFTEDGSTGAREFLARAKPHPGSYVILTPADLPNAELADRIIETLVFDPQGNYRAQLQMSAARADSVEGRLPKLSLESGGAAYRLKTGKELEGLYQQIAEQIRSSYTLGYYTEAKPGRHRLEVRVKDPSARVAARRAVLVN